MYSSPAHFKKGLQWTTAYSCCLFFFFIISLFVNFAFGTSLFFHRENGTQYIYSAELSMDTWLFQVSVCVSNATVLLRFLLNTATSSRFPTGNKLFLKNKASVCTLLFLSFEHFEKNKGWLLDDLPTHHDKYKLPTIHTTYSTNKCLSLVWSMWQTMLITNLVDLQLVLV